MADVSHADTPGNYRFTGVVVIGRNEGDRLKRCIGSLSIPKERIVYVDSGSTDDSVEWSRDQGLDVVELDMSRFFTAARARNAGWQRLPELASDIRWVQFVDGDCELDPSWLAAAQEHLKSNPACAAAAGRLRERYPNASIYNRLCDAEWDAPAGVAKACGGNAMMRLDALKEVGGFRESLIAGEEPELCVRLRAAGWQIERIAAEMALHDAAMYRFSQWWRRNVRSGYAFAEGAALHGNGPERHWVSETRRAIVWGALIPITAGGMAMVGGAHWLLLLAVYPLQMMRLAVRRDSSGGALHALFLVIGRFPEALGVASYWLNRLRSRNARLIEYK